MKWSFLEEGEEMGGKESECLYLLEKVGGEGRREGEGEWERERN